MLLLCAGCDNSASIKTWSSSDKNQDRWAIYYDYNVSANAFAEYDLVVFDRITYPDFHNNHKSTKYLAAINAGEVNMNAPEKIILEHENAILLSQTARGTAVVDLTSTRWHNIVTAQVDDAARKGFDGVMLDGLEIALKLSAQKSPQAGEEATQQAITMIDDIHARHPRMKIMLNRAFDILPQVANKIDYVLAEGILSERNDSTGQSHLVAANNYQQTAGSLRWAHGLSPSIAIYTLDYWNTSDIEGTKKIYRMQRDHGFSPYVTSPDLRHFTPEPK